MAEQAQGHERWLIEAIGAALGREPRSPVRVLGDTTGYMSIDRGDVVHLGGFHYLVRGNTRESRFGLHDQPKFWVKRACCLEDGRAVVLKLVFHEEFSVRIGEMTIKCRRSEEKEARVLELVADDPRFMHGVSRRDRAGNLVRVLDYIPGQDLLTHVMEIEKSHRDYFAEDFPRLLALVCECLAGLEFLHQNGLCHGDVRNDHLRLDRQNGLLRWIDFDLEQDFSDFDLWSAGNILQVVAGKGLVTLQRIGRERPQALERLEPGDTSVFFPHRVMNLAKVFDYVPEELNRVLMRFSRGTEEFYESMDQVVADLDDLAARQGWPRPRPLEQLRLEESARCGA